MSEERIGAGVERIERALARIREAARPAAPTDSADVEALRQRHQALRDEVAGALRELDEVLARG